MEKPNFERITKALRQWRSLRDEIIRKELVKEWEQISQSESEYPEIGLLDDLLKEYEIEILFPDLLLLGSYFIKRMKIYEEINKPDNRPYPPSKYEFELLKALDLLLNNEAGISIEIYKKQIHQVSIYDPILIRKIKEALQEKLQDGFTRRYFWDYELDIDQDWRKFIKGRLERKKNDSPKKGRPNETKHLKPMVFSLWNYLQNNTELKAEAGTSYSNKQAKFIFRFLEIHKLINQSISGKEDVIGYYLKSYIKSKNDFNKELYEFSKSRDIEKEKIEIEEFLIKYERDYRLTSERKKNLQENIKFFEEILARRKKL